MTSNDSSVRHKADARLENREPLSRPSATLSPSDGGRDGVGGRSVTITENQSSLDAASCPLCGRANECQLCTVAAYKGPCWCAKVTIPEALLARIPAELRNKACVCRECVMEFHRAKEGGVAGPKIRPGDFYFDNGVMVFTAEYHRRRGYCCGNNCRHCPYHPDPMKLTFAPTAA